jgi:hypothetical protein
MLQPSHSLGSTRIGAQDLMLKQKQEAAKAAGKIASDLVQRVMQNGAVRQEIQLRGQAHLIVYVTCRHGQQPPPYAAEIDAPFGVFTPPLENPKPILWFAEITQMMIAPTPDLPVPRRRMVGYMYAYECEPGVFTMAVCEPWATASTQYLDRKPDRIWLLFKAILCHTRPTFWSQFRSLRLSPSLCVHRELAVALRAIGLSEHEPTTRGPCDVEMWVVIALRASFIPHTTGGSLAEP